METTKNVSTPLTVRTFFSHILKIIIEKNIKELFWKISYSFFISKVTKKQKTIDLMNLFIYKTHTHTHIHLKQLNFIVGVNYYYGLMNRIFANCCIHQDPFAINHSIIYEEQQKKKKIIQLNIIKNHNDVDLKKMFG